MPQPSAGIMCRRAQIIVDSSNASIHEAETMFSNGEISRSKRDRLVNDAAARLSTAMMICGGRPEG